MSIRLEYVETPVGAESAQVSTEDGQIFSTLHQESGVVDDVQLATFEPDGWRLDGTKKLISDTSKLGWWSSEMSNDDGVFDNPPVISVSFPRPISTKGIAFRFWPSMEEWCNAITIKFYLEEKELYSDEMFPESSEWNTSKEYKNFDKIKITLLSTNKPNTFAKIQYFKIGNVTVFLPSEIVRVNLLNEIDPSLSTLSSDTMTVEIYNRNNLKIAPQKDQRIFLYKDGKLIASHYIVNYERLSDRNFKLNCQSAVGRLDDTFFGDIYEDAPIENVLQSVLGEFTFEVSPAFRDKTITGYIPVGTRREALQQIAFAIGAVVTTRGNGTIQLTQQQIRSSGRFTADKILAGAKAVTEPQKHEIRLVSHQYYKSSEEVVVFEGIPVNGESVLFTFYEPYYDYSISGGKIVDSGVNWVKITANGKVNLNAKKYIHTTSVYTKTNPNTSVSEKANVLSVENATLVNRINAHEILERLYRVSELRDVITQTAVINHQYAGQIVETPTPWKYYVAGYITTMESNFTINGHTAYVTIRGKEV